MMISVAHKALKHPMMLFVPDEEWEKIKDIPKQEELDKALMQLALRQVAQHGYELGRCALQNKDVFLIECVKCGERKGWGKQKSEWEKCKEQNIEYRFAPNTKPNFQIKDEKIAEKIKPRTLVEERRENGSFDVVEKTTNPGYFEKNAEQIMKPIKDQENR
jgi:hypothetical protein